MDWLNIHRSTLAAEAFLGCDPVQRATWLCLMAYCADQENGGRIEGASEWGDRKWQQVVRITKEEALTVCELWQWVDGVLIVWAYPVEKEEEVRRNRANGGKGGRPPKPANNQVVSSGLQSGLTETVTQAEPPAPISAETEGNRKGNRKEKGIGKESFSAEAEAIYKAYPKHTERPEAITEIGKALKIKPFAELLEAVQAFARANEGKDPQYIVSCGRWMKRQKWDDDRSTWGDPKPQIQERPTIQEWMQEGQAVAMSNTTRNGAAWPRDLCSAAYYQCASNDWRGVVNWREKLRAECLRWVGNENGRAR